MQFRFFMYFIMCAAVLFGSIQLDAYAIRVDSEVAMKVEQLLATVPIDFGGGCSNQKAAQIAQLIKNDNLRSTLDIGVYRGRSLFPQSMAHRFYTGGVAYGVDPYTNIDSVQNDHPEMQQSLDDFSKYTNFEALYLEVSNFLLKHNLDSHTKLLRMRSDDAATFFVDNRIEFDLIHIDGNHDAQMVIDDVQLYINLLKPNGYLILDDISWSSVQPALKIAQQYAETLLINQSPYDDYIILRKK